MYGTGAGLFTFLEVGHFGKEIRNYWKVLERPAGDGWGSVARFGNSKDSNFLSYSNISNCVL